MFSSCSVNIYPEPGKPFPTGCSTESVILLTSKKFWRTRPLHSQNPSSVWKMALFGKKSFVAYYIVLPKSHTNTAIRAPQIWCSYSLIFVQILQSWFPYSAPRQVDREISCILPRRLNQAAAIQNCPIILLPYYWRMLLGSIYKVFYI